MMIWGDKRYHSLDYELKVLDFDSSALGKSEREAVRSMIERLRK